MKKSYIENYVWVVMNNLETEFEYFCKMNDLDSTHELSLQVFVNEKRQSTEVVKMKNSFYLEGFFVSWVDNTGECRVFIKSKTKANELFANLKRTNNTVQKLEISNGKIKAIA